MYSAGKQINQEYIDCEFEYKFPPRVPFTFLEGGADEDGGSRSDTIRPAAMVGQRLSRKSRKSSSVFNTILGDDELGNNDDSDEDEFVDDFMRTKYAEINNDNDN